MCIRDRDGTKRKVIDIKAGCQKLDGTYALAFARTRRQDHDFARMKRQQLVIAAVRRQIDPIAILPEVPHLLDIAAGNLYTTFSREEIPLLVQLAGQVDADRIYRVVFNRAGGYGSELTGDQLRRIRDRVANIFSEPLPAPSPTPTGAPPCPPR